MSDEMVVEPSLLLKSVQFAAVRQPKVEASAVAHPRESDSPRLMSPPPVRPEPAVTVVDETVRRLDPMEVVAISSPVWSVARSDDVSAVILRLVVVAVPEMVSPPVVEPLPIVVEAWDISPCWKVWSAVHVFALERSCELETRQVPAIEKQPVARFSPVPYMVEVAEVNCAAPCIDSMEPGVVVPRPR